jgi:SAM-dependent methyltransferase
LVEDRRFAQLSVLEINEAGSLHPILSRLHRLELHTFPACDMTNLQFADESFDLVVHSDTLEHISKPERGLEQCRRVLTPGGALVFTAPVIVGRLTRSRDGLPSSYHGYDGCMDPAMLVHSEFGADLWALVLSAGFDAVEIVPYRFPSGLAIVGRVE